MERRFVLFIVLSFGILLGHLALTAYFNPKKPPQADGERVGGKAKPDDEKDRQRAAPAEKKRESQPPAPSAEERVIQAPPAVAQQPEVPCQWVTLGSLDANSPYRMLVTLTNKGAAVGRIELSSPRYLSLDAWTGYLGSLVIDEGAIPQSLRGKGCPVQVVGPGTPAAKAGLKPGDLIVAVDKQQVSGVDGFREAMGRTKPNRSATLSVLRDGKKLTFTVPLRRRPLELTRPEGDDPLSFLLTLDRYGDETLESHRARNRCIVRIFSDLSDLRVQETAISAMDVSDVDLAAGEIQILTRDGGEKQTVPMPESTKKALEKWLTARGNDPGPLFVSPATRGAQRRLSAGEIDTIVFQPRKEGELPRDAEQFIELDGLDLQTGNWEVVQSDDTKAVFRRVLPQRGLEILKTYRLDKVPQAQIDNRHFKAYHLLLDVTIRNIAGESSHEVAYQLDGPTGLPDEGAWYANKASRTWSGAGLRDVAVSFESLTPSLITCSHIAHGNVDPPWQDQSLTYIGVDAQYFSAVMIPQKDDPAEIWFAQSQPLRVGPVDEKVPRMTNTSCRLVSKPHALNPGEELSHHFMVFTGPKMPELLAHYDLGELVYYGWFGWAAVPMVKILHMFYFVVRNYGLAIILLTVLVRGCMFPLSRKQALGAQKMQELQPEIKKLTEKYKNDMEGRTKAQQELFRKHNYNPLSGCLVLFVQLPIFIALYRGLMVDIELRQAPLISQSIRWCSNLAAPDMLYRWDWMPEFIRSGVGIFGLGPYFNILPILTIALFIMQQKMFMPPATDDQTAMQQKMMKYMMVFMGLLFFKVASGLCIYFIASSLWGLAERQWLPKRDHAKPAEKPESRADAKSRTRAATEAKAKQRPAATGRDGAASRKKKSRGGK